MALHVDEYLLLEATNCSRKRTSFDDDFYPTWQSYIWNCSKVDGATFQAYVGKIRHDADSHLFFSIKLQAEVQRLNKTTPAAEIKDKNNFK